MDNKVSADELDQVLVGVEFPATIDTIKDEVAQDLDVDYEVMSFFEQIAPGTTFDSKEELLNMAEQSDKTMGEADTSGGTLASDVVEDEVI